MKFLSGVLASMVIAFLGVLTVVMSGAINIGADQTHSAIVYNFLELARTRSIAHASKDIEVPNLTQANRIGTGGADYQDMCAGCHLKPDVQSTDLSEGLYPKPPNFTDEQVVSRYKTKAGAQQSFWTIKHGIMASGMPAWGGYHDDKRIWDMVAFIIELPQLDSDQYTLLTTRFDESMFMEDSDSKAPH